MEEILSRQQEGIHVHVNVAQNYMYMTGRYLPKCRPMFVTRGMEVSGQDEVGYKRMPSYELRALIEMVSWYLDSTYRFKDLTDYGMHADAQ